MPRLTQIKETKKGRLALFLDGEFAFSLDEDTFAAAALHQDDELEDWQIEELRKKSETRRALDKAMDYLSLRDHAAGELYQKLCRKFDAHSAAYAVARAGELSALDDLQCAEPVTYTLIQEADAFVITVQRDGARAAACMLCEIEEERAGMLTRFLYENAVEPAHTSAVLHDLCGSKVG